MLGKALEKASIKIKGFQGLGIWMFGQCLLSKPLSEDGTDMRYIVTQVSKAKSEKVVPVRKSHPIPV